MAAVVDEKTLECPICRNCLQDPCAIPCYHVFCRSCITKWLNKPNCNLCPTCRAPAAVSQVKTFPLMDKIIEAAEFGQSCESCRRIEASLSHCEHCSKSICNSCQEKHLQEVKDQIAELSVTLANQAGPRLGEQHFALIELMSQLTADSARLTKELSEAHKDLVMQICSLHQKSTDTINRVEVDSRLPIEENIALLNALVSRIGTILNSSAKIIEEKDTEKLLLLDNDVFQLQAAVDEFQKTLTNLDLANLDLNDDKLSIGGIDINQTFKNIPELIAETDMLKNVDA